jgi:hypothetical protein
MSSAPPTLIKEDMEYMGPVRLSDVEASQQRIVDVVRRLDAGDIAGRGGDKDHHCLSGDGNTHVGWSERRRAPSSRRQG